MRQRKRTLPRMEAPEDLLLRLERDEKTALSTKS